MQCLTVPRVSPLLVWFLSLIILQALCKMESPGYQLMTHLPTLKRCSDVKHKGKGDWHVLYLLATSWRFFWGSYCSAVLWFPKSLHDRSQGNETISSSTAPAAILRSVKIINWVSSFNARSVTRETSSDLERMEEIWVVARTTNWTFYRASREFRESTFLIFYLPMFNKSLPIMME